MKVIHKFTGRKGRGKKRRIKEENAGRLRRKAENQEDRNMKQYQFWFATGSQDLYGEECLAHVAEHSRKIVDYLNQSGLLPYEVVWKPTLITNELIRRTFNEANADEACAGAP